MNFCPQCGQALTGTPFCPNCGAPTAPPPAPPAPPTSQPPAPHDPDATIVMPAAAPPSQGPGTLGMPVVAPPPRRRTGLVVGLVVAALVLLGGGVAAAIALAGGDDDPDDGGSSGSDSWPADASQTSFCDAMQDVDDAFDEEGMTWQDVQDSFDDLAEVGTPDDFPADLREVLMEFADLAADAEDGDAFEAALTDEMNDDAEGIDDYLDENCPDEEDEADEQVQVPDLVGMTESAAVAVLEGTGLELETLEATSSDVPAGRVISMSPDAGTLVDPGSLVSVTISTGAEQVVVPDVTGLPEADALAVLADAGFTTESIPTVSDTVAAGLVIGTIPDAGESAEPGALVSLQLSTGPAVAPTE